VDTPALRVLIVPDKFKGTLTATQAATAIAAGWGQARPDDDLDLAPMSDGGDGFGEVIGGLLGAVSETVATVDAAHHPIEAGWWWHRESATAVIESAEVIGLWRLAGMRPESLDTFGLGEVLRAAGSRARHIVMGVGGSATNDGGVGVARALGWRFADAGGQEITRWIDLVDLHAVEPPLLPWKGGDLVVAVDVANPLLGPQGCARIFGPQKGLVDLNGAERALGQLAAVMADQLGIDLAVDAGAGAAGGLGFGMAAFAGARLQPGFAVFADLARLEERIAAADVVITGEGAVDAQSLMGKGVGGVADMARRAGVPCVALAGTVVGEVTGFSAVHGLTELTTAADARGDAARWLTLLALGVAKRWVGHPA